MSTYYYLAKAIFYESCFAAITVIISCFYINHLLLKRQQHIFTAMSVKHELHKVVLFHRKKAKLGRNELAELAGVGKTVIYDIEKGKKTVRWSTIMTILAALNIDIKFQSLLMEEYEKSNNKNT